MTASRGHQRECKLARFQMVPLDLFPLLDALDLDPAQLAVLLGVSLRTVERYLASGRVPATVRELAALLMSDTPARTAAGTLARELREKFAPPDAPATISRERRAQLLSFAEGYALAGIYDQARACCVEAGLTVAEADRRLGRALADHNAAATAVAFARNAQRRAYHAAYMRAARRAGRYPDRRRRHDQPLRPHSPAGANARPH